MRLDKTTRDFEIERVAKEKRDFDEGAAAAMAIFDEKSAERKTQFDGVNA